MENKQFKQLMDSVDNSINRDNKIYEINGIIDRKFPNCDSYNFILIRHYLIVKSSRGFDLQKIVVLLEENNFSTLEELINYIK